MTPTTLLSAADLRSTVRRLGQELSSAYADGLLLVAVLKGSVPFVADLVRAITVPVAVDFLAISSYAPGTGRVRLVMDLDADIFGRDVVVVEDIVDTGLTLTYLLDELRQRGPRSLEVCALLDKTVRRIVPLSIRFAGATIPDGFVIGYGLDHGERYRNLDRVLLADLTVLRNDPDAYVAELFHG